MRICPVCVLLLSPCSIRVVQRSTGAPFSEPAALTLINKGPCLGALLLLSTVITLRKLEDFSGICEMASIFVAHLIVLTSQIRIHYARVMFAVCMCFMPLALHAATGQVRSSLCNDSHALLSPPPSAAPHPVSPEILMLFPPCFGCSLCSRTISRL